MWNSVYLRRIAGSQSSYRSTCIIWVDWIAVFRQQKMDTYFQNASPNWSKLILKSFLQRFDKLTKIKVIGANKIGLWINSFWQAFCVSSVSQCKFILRVICCFFSNLANIKLYKHYDTGLKTGVAKSIVRVVRFVHLLLRTSNLFQLTCPWTIEKTLISWCLKNTILFTKVAAYTNTHRYFLKPN